MMREYLESVATVFNICGNVCLLFKTWHDPNAPTPKVVVKCQVCANCLWAIIIRDMYLLTTSLSSLIMQLSSLYLMVFHRKTRQFIKIATSETQLPCMLLPT